VPSLGLALLGEAALRLVESLLVTSGVLVAVSPLRTVAVIGSPVGWTGRARRRGMARNEGY
jgi:hypothetical protein